MSPAQDASPEDPPASRTFSLDAFPHARALGLEVELLADGRLRLRAPYHEHLIGDPATGVIHGGVVTTILDTGCGVAAGLKLPEGKAVATLDLRIDYMRPSKPGDAITGYCECYRMTRSVAFCRGVAYDSDRSGPVATASAAFIINSYGALK
ncbi:MAG: PaaI family thioesterase [Pikeienuella sp.]